MALKLAKFERNLPSALTAAEPEGETDRTPPPKPERGVCFCGLRSAACGARNLLRHIASRSDLAPSTHDKTALTGEVTQTLNNQHS